MREVNGLWYRNTMGKQFLKIIMPKDAISMQATVKTASGIHKITFDRWGDATKKYENYNSRRHPTYKDEMTIKRYRAEEMVLDPLPSPTPVLRKRKNQYNPRAEGLRNEENDGGRSWHTDMTRRGRRRSPYYPPSPRYPGSFSEEERDPIVRPQPLSAAQGAPEDPWASPEEVRVYSSDRENEEVPDLVHQLDGQGEESEGFSSGETDLKAPEKTKQTPTRPGTPVPIPKRMQNFLDSTAELDQILEEAIEDMDLEEAPAAAGAASAPPPGILKRAKIVTNLDQNKVVHLDKTDTQMANPGRHRSNTTYHTAEVQHVVFKDPPASPEPEKEKAELKAPGNPQSGIIPLEPEIVVANREEEATSQNPPDSD